jgi:hypothetical protein
MVAIMKHKISLLPYVGIFGMPTLLALLVVAYAIKIYYVIDLLVVLLALTALVYSIAGISEVFLHERK